ncbi:MAG: hypothetical protein ACR2LF_05615 [Jatrophihabitantaceae bacterium]
MGWIPRAEALTQTGGAHQLEDLVGRAARANGWLLYGAIVLTLCAFAGDVVLTVLLASGTL